MPSPHADHRKRLKQRFLDTGLDKFQPHEILELLLFFSIPQGDTNVIAHRMLDSFDNFSAVFDADIEQLLEINGVGEHTAILIKMIPQLASCYAAFQGENQQLDTSAKICKYFFSRYIGVKTEQLRIACLNDELKVVSYGTISEGGVSSVPINTRKIVEFTYRANCDMIVLAHNHPNGLPMASDEDVAITAQLVPILRNVGIKLLDHVIVGKKYATSMYDAGHFTTFR